MKLRTEMKDSGYGTIEPRLKLGDNGGAVFHDAACAHALLQAMDEEIERVSTVEYNSREICAHFMAKVKDRAAEILASWGVEQEVAG